MLSSFKKSCTKASDNEISIIRKQLIGKSWKTTDEALSASKGRELYVTLQSVLSRPPIQSSIFRNYMKTHMKFGRYIPYGYSMIYCNPTHFESEMSPDGYDNFNSPVLNNIEFFRRRMWVGGELIFEPGNRLKFGERVDFEEKVTNVKAFNKNSTIFVDYRRNYSNMFGLSLIEKRRLCYLNELYSEAEETSSDLITPDHFIFVTPSLITNFRMSALTFNSHLLHYDLHYCNSIEGYPKVVVEAPLLLELALQFWLNLTNSQISLRKIKYKISRPFFTNEKLKICISKSSKTQTNIWLQNLTGQCGFVATLTVSPSEFKEQLLSHK